jgi:hypothetical protein
MSDKMEKNFYVLPLLREGGWVSTYRFNRPDYMERSIETRIGFFRHAASEGNVQQFEELLQTPEVTSDPHLLGFGGLESDA